MANTIALRESLHQLIDQIDDQATLQAMYTLLNPPANVGVYSLQGKALNQDAIESMLEESEDDIEANRVISQKALSKQMQSWRKPLEK